jgi:hypothetical protein
MANRQTSTIASSKLCRASVIRFAMSRGFVVLAAAMIMLSSFVIASTVARSDVDHPYQTKADFDQAFAAVGGSATPAKDVEKLRQAGLKRVYLAKSAS